MRELVIGLGERSYPITVGTGLLDGIGDELKTHFPAGRYGVVADERVAELYGGRLTDSLQRAGLEVELLSFPPGERHKNLATVGSLASRAARRRLDRSSMFIALGGGITGDITGFLASIYMRGVPFVQIPTSLLAQVDSSVGGKTGVDIPEGKNLVGTFYQPRAVFIDTSVLGTLPRREYLNGMAEVIKHGIIRDGDYFEFLVAERPRILELEETVVEQMIYRSCRIKAEVVAEDERETDLRRILNFGHTIGHAVEAASDFTLLHGFAVAIGINAAVDIARNRDLLPASEADRITAALRAYGLPLEIPSGLDPERIKTYLQSDKKNVDGAVFFILPRAVGEVEITDQVSPAEVDRVLARP